MILLQDAARPDIGGELILGDADAPAVGAATAKLFAKEGAKVVLTDMLADEGQTIAEGIVAANGAAQVPNPRHRR